MQPSPPSPEMPPSAWQQLRAKQRLRPEASSLRTLPRESIKLLEREEPAQVEEQGSCRPPRVADSVADLKSWISKVQADANEEAQKRFLGKASKPTVHTAYAADKDSASPLPAGPSSRDEAQQLLRAWRQVDRTESAIRRKSRKSVTLMKSETNASLTMSNMKFSSRQKNLDDNMRPQGQAVSPLHQLKLAAQKVFDGHDALRPIGVSTPSPPAPIQRRHRVYENDIYGSDVENRISSRHNTDDDKYDGGEDDQRKEIRVPRAIGDELLEFAETGEAHNALLRRLQYKEPSADAASEEYRLELEAEAAIAAVRERRKYGSAPQHEASSSRKTRARANQESVAVAAAEARAAAAARAAKEAAQAEAEAAATAARAAAAAANVTAEVFRRRCEKRFTRRLLSRWRAIYSHGCRQALRRAARLHDNRIAARAFRGIALAASDARRARSSFAAFVDRHAAHAFRRALRGAFGILRASAAFAARQLRFAEDRWRWRWLGRCWAAWSRYSKSVAEEREHELLQVALAEQRRHELLADRWFEARTVSTVFLHWCMLVVEAREEAERRRAHSVQKTKIASFVKRVTTVSRPDLPASDPVVESKLPAIVGSRIRDEEELCATQQQSQQADNSRRTVTFCELNLSSNSPPSLMPSPVESLSSHSSRAEPSICSPSRATQNGSPDSSTVSDTSAAKVPPLPPLPASGVPSKKIRKQTIPEPPRVGAAAAELEAKRELARAAMKVATLHFALAQKSFRGLKPWKRLVEMRRINWAKAVQFRADFVFAACWDGWIALRDEARLERRKMRGAAIAWTANLVERRRCKHAWGQWRAAVVAVYARARIVTLRLAAQRKHRYLIAWGASAQQHHQELSDRASRVKILVALRCGRTAMRQWKSILYRRREQDAMRARRAQKWKDIRLWLGET